MNEEMNSNTDFNLYELRRLWIVQPAVDKPQAKFHSKSLENVRENRAKNWNPATGEINPFIHVMTRRSSQGLDKVRADISR